MAYQGEDRGTITLPCDAAIAANLIVIESGTNAGNVAHSTAVALGFVGVTIEPSDANNYVAIQTRGIVQITAGGSITAGNSIASDANGKAVANTPVFSSAAKVAQIVGVAMTTASSGNLVDVLIQPQLALN